MAWVSKQAVGQLGIVITIILLTIHPAIIPVQPASGSHGARTNATVYFEDTPEPGATEVTMWSSTVSYFPEGKEEYVYEGNISIIWTPLIASGCQFENLEVFGIDRDNDQPGTETDESAIPYATNGSYFETGVDEHQDNLSSTDWDYVEKGYIDWNDPNNTLSDNLQIYHGDQFIAKQNNCYALPDQAGWYRDRQEAIGVNGSASPKARQTDWYYSHWYYICDCESYDQAVEKIGPPPSETSESTASPSGNDSQTTPTATSTGTAASPTPGTSTSTGTATITEVATATPAETTTTEMTATQPATASPAVRDTESAAPETAATTTSTGQPGFGLIAGMLGVLAAALLGKFRQRDRR